MKTSNHTNNLPQNTSLRLEHCSEDLYLRENSSLEFASSRYIFSLVRNLGKAQLQAYILCQLRKFYVIQ
jgi:hypothetical protein